MTDHPLLEGYLEGEPLSPAEVRQVGAWVCASPRNAEHLLREAFDRSQLRNLLRGERTHAGFRGIGSPHRTDAHRWRQRLLRAAVAAVLVFGVVGSVALLASRAKRPAAAPEMIATLIDSTGASWGDSDLPTAAGSQLHGGFLRLKSGSATVEFYSGARVTLTGPCEFGLNGPLRGLLRRGSIRAYCPPSAHGFTVAAPGCAVVDLGTRFRLAVDDAGRAQVDVEEGRVQLQSPRGVRTLTRNQVGRIDATGQVTIATAWFDGPVPLGALFGDRPGTPLSEAVRSDVPGTPAQPGGLGVERVVHGGARDNVAEIAPGLRINLSPLNWRAASTLREPTNRGWSGLPGQMGLSTTGHAPRRGSAPEVGIGMHANLLATFDLAAIREAGPIRPDARMWFVSDRAGIDDSGRGAEPVELLAIVSSEREILSITANGQPIGFTPPAGGAGSVGSAWRLPALLPQPLRGDGRYVRFDVPLPPEARYLTLISIAAGRTVVKDHAVFSGAKIVVETPSHQQEN